MFLPSNLALGRLASQQCLAYCQSLALRRVALLHGLSTVARQYATQPVSRPKAHTGRTTSTRKTKAAPKATQSTASTTKRTATSKNSRAKAKAKPAAKKKAKPKKKPVKAKTRGRRPLTEKQKVAAANRKKSADIRSLREKALKAPKQLPQTAFLVVSSELSKGQKGDVTNNARDAGAQYRSLSIERREVGP